MNSIAKFLGWLLLGLLAAWAVWRWVIMPRQQAQGEGPKPGQPVPSRWMTALGLGSGSGAQALVSAPVSPTAAAALIAPQVQPTAGPIATESPTVGVLGSDDGPPSMGLAPGSMEALKSEEVMYSPIVPSFSFNL